MVADVTEVPTFKASVPRTLFQVPVAQIAHNAVTAQVFIATLSPGRNGAASCILETSAEPKIAVHSSRVSFRSLGNWTSW